MSYDDGHAGTSLGQDQRHHPEWQVILHNDGSRKVVLFNPRNRQLSVQNSRPAEEPAALCMLCRRPWNGPLPNSRRGPARAHATNHSEPSMDSDYFEFLSSTSAGFDHLNAHPTAGSGPISAAAISSSGTGKRLLLGVRPRLGSMTSSHETVETEVIEEDIHLPRSIFNPGYYDRFFIEGKKLGRGLRGSVFLCHHVLNHILLGEYAVKKVAVGDDRTWLFRMLKEVSLLTRLQHPNIVMYKHCWLEEHQLTFFGPEIPVLFILMECASGNLEEYIEVQYAPSMPASKPTRCRRQIASAEGGTWAYQFGGIGVDEFGRKRRYLKPFEILKMFRDIVSGLAHLHRLGVLHRDLKPSNLLLSYSEPRDLNDIPRVLISDFGECQEEAGERVGRLRTGATGTIEFVAPELLQRDPGTGQYANMHSKETDLWSLGMILYYMAYSQLPFTQIEDVELLALEILRLRGVPFPSHGLERVPGEVRKLIRNLLSLDPKNRFSAVDICTRLRGTEPHM